MSSVNGLLVSLGN